jgi:RNA 2',3'-cyclic 3'-phosphodiesterase
MSVVNARDTKRLFFAISLPDTIKEIINTQEKELIKSGSGIKWVNQENLHITLKFLGEVPLAKIDSLKKIIDQNFNSQKTFKASLVNIGAFPSIDSPQIIWAGFNTENNILAQLVEKLETELSGLGFKKEVRKFQTHATIGRARSKQNMTSLIERIRTINEDHKRYDFQIDNLTLFESKLSPKGPKYSILHQARFK